MAEYVKTTVDLFGNIVNPRTDARGITMLDEFGHRITMQEFLDNMGPISGSAGAVQIVDSSNYYTATNVELALKEIGLKLLNTSPTSHTHSTLYYSKAEVDAIVNSLEDIFAGTEFAAHAITNLPQGNISATTVQGALNELDNEKVSKSGDTINGNLTIAGITSISNGTISTQLAQTTTGVTLTNAAIYGGTYRLPRFYIQTSSTAPGTMQEGDVLLIYT